MWRSCLFASVNERACASLGLRRTLATPHAVAITFDDGPHPEGTPEILEILAARGAHATFFLIGEQVVRRPELARRILAEGHQIALHGDRHRLQMRLTARQLREDLRRGRAAIEDATAHSPAHHRPPYGIYSPAGLQATREAGLEPILWSAWGKDWRRFTTPGRIAGRVIRDLVPGAVILLHDADYYSARDSHRRTAGALKLILTEMQSTTITTVRQI